LVFQVKKSLDEGFELLDADSANVEKAMVRLNRLNNTTGGESVAQVRDDLQSVYAALLWCIPRWRSNAKKVWLS